ncbi:hypothetical protein EBX31_13405 [bacterium]|nr:hypothetical protein [bacterium]
MFWSSVDTRKYTATLDFAGASALAVGVGLNVSRTSNRSRTWFISNPLGLLLWSQDRLWFRLRPWQGNSPNEIWVVFAKPPFGPEAKTDDEGRA